MRPLGLKVITAALLGLALSAPMAVASPPAAQAETRRGSNTRVIGRGDILSTIFAGLKPTSRKGRVKPSTLCRNIRFNDAEIEMLVALIASADTPEASKPFMDLFQEHLVMETTDMPSAHEFDVLARHCVGHGIVDVWATPRQASASVAGELSRNMLTRLPEPIVAQSPPAGTPVPINQPVFVSVEPENWRPIHSSLEVAGMFVEVRAEPVGLRTYTGEPQSQVGICDGPGKKFDPANPYSARKQAKSAETCTMTYRQASRKPGTPGRAWLGSVSVLWRAEWRSNDGIWRSLGVIPRTRLFERTTIEVGTSITRIVAPSRAKVRRSS